MLVHTKRGLYCEAGDFFIDPSGACARAVLTHAHSDHARRGAKQYYAESSGIDLVRSRLGKYISIQGIPYRERFQIGPVTLSFHPAGHILGSSQVRLEYENEVWVASGDYKREPDPTCAPFEVVPCDVFVSEATFGTPAFRWDHSKDLGREIFDWWEANARDGYHSVLFAYSLGKAQRVLGVLEPHANRPVLCDPASTELTSCYRAQGVKLAPTRCLGTLEDTEKIREKLSGELFLVPQSFLRSDRAHLLGSKYRTAFASGWMAGGHQGLDHGFLMSDHADWDDLIRTVQESRSKRVYIQHRGKGALVKHLKSLGLDAYPVEELTKRAPEQLSLF